MSDRDRTFFALWDNSEEELYRTVKAGMCGGSSIVFTRHHKKGETLIKGDPTQVCNKIIGKINTILF